MGSEFGGYEGWQDWGGQDILRNKLGKAFSSEVGNDSIIKTTRKDDEGGRTGRKKNRVGSGEGRRHAKDGEVKR